MAKQIARLLKTNMMADIDMPALAQFLQSQGRKGDTVLAHINPKEAVLLQKMGGAGTENPVTGLPEFYDGTFDYDYNRRYEPDINDIVTEQRLRQYQQPQEFDYSRATTPIVEPRPQASDTYFTGRQSVPAYAGGESKYFDTSNEPSQRTTISPSYLTNYKISGDGDFGASPAQVPYFSVPQTKDRVFSPDGVPYANLIAPARPDAFEQVAVEETPTGEQKPGMFRRGVEYLKDLTGLSGGELVQLGLATGLGIQGARGAREMQRQGEEARREQEAIAAPYRERGAQLLAEAERGQLTPQAQQSLQAMRARMAQGAEARGGVGAQQVAAQVEAFRQQLLANQYDYGMKVSNIGDNLMLGAIRTGLEADRYATQMTNNYYTNMARILGGMGGGEKDAVTQPTTIRGVA